MYKLWGLTHITPGAIAASAMLVRRHHRLRYDGLLTNRQSRWAPSQDDFLQDRGLNTGIKWHSEFESYLKYLLQGLQQHKASVLNIFRVWDDMFFPNTDTSLAGNHAPGSNNEQSTRDALDALNADKEDLGDNENNSGET
jgi:hypothetical protein